MIDVDLIEISQIVDVISYCIICRHAFVCRPRGGGGISSSYTEEQPAEFEGETVIEVYLKLSRAGLGSAPD